MIRKLLFRLSAHRPCRLIQREDGQPYLERYYLFSIFGWRVYLHRFIGGDSGEELHDHPWYAVSLILSGGYIERVLLYLGEDGMETLDRRLGVLSVNRIPPSRFHAIIRAKKNTWTLFIRGPRIINQRHVDKHWGFIRQLKAAKQNQQVWTYQYTPAPWHTSESWHKTAPSGHQANREPLNNPEAI